MESKNGISKFLKESDKIDFNNSHLLEDNFSSAVGKTKNISLAMDSYRVINPNGAKMFDMMATPNGYLISLSVSSALNFGTVISGYKKNIKTIDNYHLDVIEFQYKNPKDNTYHTKYILASDVQKIGSLNNNNNPEDFSNFQLFGIGKESEAQKARRAKIKKALEDAKKNIQHTVQDIGKNIKQTTKDIVHNENLKKGIKANFLTYNPAVAIPRSSALLAFRVNLFGVSSRLYPAFLDEATLIKYNFNIENAKNAKVAWESVANFWEDKLGGDRKKLKEAISGAWNKPVFKTKKAKARKASTSTFDGNYDSLYNNYSYPTGYDELAVGAYISAGLSIVGGIVKIIGDKGAKKNPYNAGTPEAQNFDNQMSGENPPPLNQAELNKIIQGAIDDKKKGLPLDNTGIDASDLNKDDSKILGIPKTGFYIGLGVLVLVSGILLYRKYGK